jgi:intein/homing endonuclease
VRYALYNNKIIVESSTSNLVYHSNKIIDDGEYGLYQDQGVACLSEKVKIKTSQKDKNISALKVGDYLSDNNKVEKIVKHNRNYYYRIILNNNDVIEASNDHRFILLNKEIKTTEQLKANDYLTNDLYVKEIRKINQSLDMYEIKTSTNKYELYNGIICECENI